MGKTLENCTAGTLLRWGLTLLGYCRAIAVVGKTTISATADRETEARRKSHMPNWAEPGLKSNSLNPQAR